MFNDRQTRAQGGVLTDDIETGTCTTPGTTCHSFFRTRCGVQFLCMLAVFQNCVLRPLPLAQEKRQSEFHPSFTSHLCFSSHSLSLFLISSSSLMSLSLSTALFLTLSFSLFLSLFLSLSLSLSVDLLTCCPVTHRRALWTTHATSLFLFWSRCGVFFVKFSFLHALSDL